MGVTDSVNALAAKVAELYREIVTTSVRFEDLRRTTDNVLTRLESTVQQLASKVAAIHDDHVREKAALEAQITILQGRLNSLSEQALHTVVRDVAREIVTNNVNTQQRQLNDKVKPIEPTE